MDGLRQICCGHRKPRATRGQSRDQRRECVCMQPAGRTGRRSRPEDAEEGVHVQLDGGGEASEHVSGDGLHHLLGLGSGGRSGGAAIARLGLHGPGQDSAVLWWSIWRPSTFITRRYQPLKRAMFSAVEHSVGAVAPSPPPPPPTRSLSCCGDGTSSFSGGGLSRRGHRRHEAQQRTQLFVAVGSTTARGTAARLRPCSRS